MSLDKQYVDRLVETTSRLAIVGVAKNCGKTTTLNALMHVLSARVDVCVGLVSIGIDGESHDMLIGTKKPEIIAQAGTLAVTTTGALEMSTAQVTYLDALNIHTPLGQLVVVRVESAGTLILAGVRHRRDLVSVLVRLGEQGATMCLIDGAYGRTMAAHASVCDGVLLCTGAVLDRRIDQIVEHTRGVWQRLSLSEVSDPNHRALMEAALTQNRALLYRLPEQRSAHQLVDGDVQIPLPSRSALLGLSKGRGLWSEAIDAIAIPGLISDRVVEELLLHSRPEHKRTLIVADGTNVQVSDALWRRLREHWHVQAHDVVPVLGIAMNPTSVAGYQVDEAHLREALCWAPTLWVFNPSKV